MKDFEKSIAIIEVMYSGYFNIKKFDYIYVLEHMHSYRNAKRGDFLSSYTKVPDLQNLVNGLSGWILRGLKRNYSGFNLKYFYRYRIDTPWLQDIHWFDKYCDYLPSTGFFDIAKRIYFDSSPTKKGALVKYENKNTEAITSDQKKKLMRK